MFDKKRIQPEKKNKKIYEKFTPMILNYPMFLKHGSGVLMRRDRTRLLLSFKRYYKRDDIKNLIKDTGSHP